MHDTTPLLKPKDESEREAVEVHLFESVGVPLPQTIGDEYERQTNRG